MLGRRQGAGVYLSDLESCPLSSRCVCLCARVRQKQRQRHKLRKLEKIFASEPCALDQGFETFDPDATFYLKQRPDAQIGSGVDKPLCLAAHSVEDCETWLQVLSFHTQKRRILHGDAGPASLLPPGVLFRRQTSVTSHTQT